MISFIIVNFHGSRDTIGCVNSIYNSSFYNYEIVIVDNSLNESDYNLLKNYFTDKINTSVHKIDNYGIGNACNVGVLHSSGDILFFLNNDTIINDVDNLELLEEAVLKYNNIVSPKVYNSDGTTQKNVGGFFSIISCIIYFLQLSPKIKNNGLIRSVVKYLFHKNRAINAYLGSESDFYNSTSIDWVSGCSLVVSKTNFEKLGGFDEKFFMYFEDQDFCYRHSRYGYECKLINAISLTHFVGGSQNNVSLKMELIKAESLIYFARKNINFGWVLKYILFTLCFILLFKKRFRFLFINCFLK